MTRFAGAALGVLLSLGPAGAGPARAAGIPASFDCAKAGSTVEKFVCAHAVLRWQDLALSRAYAAAKAKATGPARDDLVLAQRDWVRERDRRCIADRTFKELSDASSGPADQAYQCLETVYLGRRRDLQDLAAAPATPTDIGEMDLARIAAARPEIAEEGKVRVSAIGVSPDGATLAILLPSLELDGPDQVWLYRVADGALVAATPAPDLEQPHPDGSPAAIKSLAWQGGTLYARIAIWSLEGEGEEGTTAVYAATLEGSRRLDEVPADIATLLDAASHPGAVGQEEVPEEDWDIIDTMRGNRDFLAWADDLGHGTIELKVRKRVPGSPAHLVAWGGWDLAGFLLGPGQSRLVYPADTGIALFDMTTHGERRIAGTSQGDRPYAISADPGRLVWSTRNACGDEFMTERDEDAPERFCIARLPQPEESR